MLQLWCSNAMDGTVYFSRRIYFFEAWQSLLVAYPTPIPKHILPSLSPQQKLEKSNAHFLAFAARVGSEPLLGNEICVERVRAFCRKVLVYTGKKDKSGIILSFLLTFPVFTMRIMPQTATRWSRGRSQDD